MKGKLAGVKKREVSSQTIRCLGNNFGKVGGGVCSHGSLRATGFHKFKKRFKRPAELMVKASPSSIQHKELGRLVFNKQPDR